MNLVDLPTSSRPQCQPRTWLRLALTLVLLSLSAPPARAARPMVQGAGDVIIHLPLFVRLGAGNPLPPDEFIYMPHIAVAPEAALNIIANPSFENEFWFTDATGNQRPSGWTFFSPGSGQTMPFPTRRQGGGTVPAISGGQGEYVHKYFWQLPESEWLGGSRGLIVDGELTYKVFSDHIPHALRLSQTLTYLPGRTVRVTGYIVGETQPLSCSGSGVLEDDHFVASVQLGSASDTRFYSVMRGQHALAGNERPWNMFSVTSQVPANGLLPLVVIMQSNWGCPVDFFVDHFQAYNVTP